MRSLAETVGRLLGGKYWVFDVNPEYNRQIVSVYD